MTAVGRHIYTAPMEAAARAYGLTSETPFILSMPATAAVLYLCTALPFLLTAALCAWADARPARFSRHKLQQKPLTPAERGEAWRVAALNMLLVNFVFGIGPA